LNWWRLKVDEDDDECLMVRRKKKEAWREASVISFSLFWLF
jgi:hypothetical protein